MANGQGQGGSYVQTLKVVRKTFTMLSEKRTQVLDITKQIRDIVLSADVKEGILLVNSLHTTCALFVNEFQGALVEDLKTMLDRLVAEDGGYKHDDPRFSDCERGNASSHLRAALLGRSVAVGISGGELSLGPLPVDPVRRARRTAVAEHRHPDHGGLTLAAPRPSSLAVPPDRRRAPPLAARLATPRSPVVD